MKKIMITMMVALMVTGCMQTNEYCVESEMPPTLHPVLSCPNCTWQEK